MLAAADVLSLPSDSVLPVCIKNTFIDLDDESCHTCVRSAGRCKTLPSKLPIGRGTLALKRPIHLEVSADSSTADEGEDHSSPSSSMTQSPRQSEVPDQTPFAWDVAPGQPQTSWCFYPNYFVVPWWYVAAPADMADYVPAASDAHSQAPSADGSVNCSILGASEQEQYGHKPAHSEWAAQLEVDWCSEYDSVINSVREAVVGNGNVVSGTDKFVEADECTVIIRMRKERIRYKSAVVNSAQKALLRGADGTHGVCVLGDGATPFEPTQYGFSARLGLLRHDVNLSSSFIKKGWCRCSDKCVDEQAATLRVNFVVWKVD